MSHCIFIVRFPSPKGMEEQAISGAASTAPIYRGLAMIGLTQKNFLHGDKGAGGVYLWGSRAAAEAWFMSEHVEAPLEKFGAAPTSTWHDTYVTADNASNKTRITQPDLQAAE